MVPGAGCAGPAARGIYSHGGLVPEGQIPEWFAGLGFVDGLNEAGEQTPSSGEYLCGGSLVSDKCVLTAAHCVNKADDRKFTGMIQIGQGTNAYTFPNWTAWDQSALTLESNASRIGFAPMPDANVGRLISRQTSTVQVQLGNGKFLNGTANMHPYYFQLYTTGKCEQFATKRSCNKASPCSWHGNTCTLAGSQFEAEYGVRYIQLYFNDIALVVLDEAQPDAEKVTLSDSGDATERCRGRGRRRCRQRLSAARRSALIGRGQHMPNGGGRKVDIGEKEYPTFWEGFCAKLNGTAAMTSPVRVNGAVFNIISLPKRNKRLFKKWCTPTDPSYLDPHGKASPTGQPKWTDFLERSTPQACEQWNGYQFITEDIWNPAPGYFTPVIPTKDAAFDAVVCAAQTRPLFKQSNRVPNRSCKGDSGGPLVEGSRNSLGAQYGVVSFGSPRMYKKKTSLVESVPGSYGWCAGLMEICRCGRKVVQCYGPTGAPFCPKEMSVGWRYVGQSQNVYAKVAHFKKWLEQQESVCGKMRWSSDV